MTALDQDPEWQEWQAWVQSRPPHIQRAIRQYPFASKYTAPDGQVLHLIGWSETEGSEDVTLIFSPIDPSEDFNLAAQTKVYICASHLGPVNA